MPEFHSLTTLREPPATIAASLAARPMPTPFFSSRASGRQTLFRATAGRATHEHLFVVARARGGSHCRSCRWLNVVAFFTEDDADGFGECREIGKFSCVCGVQREDDFTHSQQRGNEGPTRSCPLLIADMHVAAWWQPGHRPDRASRYASNEVVFCCPARGSSHSFCSSCFKVAMRLHARIHEFAAT